MISNNPKEKKYVLDLCSGISGFSLALKWLVGGFRTVCYVEIDEFCQKVLQKRIGEGYLDDAPIWSDLRTFPAASFDGVVDIIVAGFPCQPFSVAGKQAGENDERNLWPDIWRIIREVRPSFVFLENVSALLAGERAYAGRVFGDLAEIGYGLRWDCIPASAVGAPHRRDRFLLVADAESGDRYDDENVAWDEGVKTQAIFGDGGCPGRGDPRWPVEPDVGRVAYGVPDRVDRLKSLGNAVVPGVVARAWFELAKKLDDDPIL